MLNIPYWAFGIMTLLVIAVVFISIYLNLKNVLWYNIFTGSIFVIIVATLFSFIFYSRQVH